MRKGRLCLCLCVSVSVSVSVCVRVQSEVSCHWDPGSVLWETKVNLSSQLEPPSDHMSRSQSDINLVSLCCSEPQTQQAHCQEHHSMWNLRRHMHMYKWRLCFKACRKYLKKLIHLSCLLFYFLSSCKFLMPWFSQTKLDFTWLSVGNPSLSCHPDKSLSRNLQLHSLPVG